MHLRATLNKEDVNEAVRDLMVKRKKRVVGDAHFLIQTPDRPGEQPSVTLYVEREDADS